MDVFLIFGIFVSLVLWLRSYAAFFRIRSFRPNKTHRTIAAVVPALCVLLVVIVLWRWSAPEVRSIPVWILLYAAGGAAWLQVGLSLLSLLGIGARVDVLERQNPAAAWAVYGATLGTTFCYAGSNIGRGPGPDVVLFCAVLSTAFLFGFWLLLEGVFRLADRITIDRDESAGMRAGGWFSSAGLIFGGAVSGNWVSVGATLRDFIRYGWAALLLLMCAITIEWIFKSFQQTKHRSASAAVAFAYFVAATIYVAIRGIH